MAKLDVSWQDGVFLGYRSLSGEVVVGTADGAENEDSAQATRGAAVDQRLPRHGGRFAMETEPER